MTCLMTSKSPIRSARFKIDAKFAFRSGLGHSQKSISLIASRRMSSCSLCAKKCVCKHLIHSLRVNPPSVTSTRRTFHRLVSKQFIIAALMSFLQGIIVKRQAHLSIINRGIHWADWTSSSIRGDRTLRTHNSPHI